MVEKISKLTWEPHDMPMTPHLVFSFLDAGTKQLKKILDNSYHYFLVYIKENNGRFGFAEEDLQRLGNFIYNKAIKKSNFLKHKEEEWTRCQKEFITVIHKIDEINLSKLSNRQLIVFYKKFYKSYVFEYSLPTIANAVDFYTQNKIKNILESVIKDSMKCVQHLTLINSPTKSSFSNIEKNSLLKIASWIKRNKGLSDIFEKENPENIILKIKKFPKICKLIKSHTKKYFWLNNNYAQITILDELYFIKEIKAIILNKIEPLREINEIKSSLNKIKSSKKKLIQKLKLDKATRLLIDLQEASIYWRDVRKMYNQIADHYHFLFLQEASRRLPLSLKELTYTLPEEFISLLSGQKINRNILKERKENCLIITTPAKHYILTGSEAGRINDKLYNKVKNFSANILKGTIASLGRAKGNVKVIMEPQDFYKMQKGDILVTSMTRPEFVPVMKLAGAIITDEGGVTCHAAIISRELRIPCIIGTKVATKILKDGDLVEVDTNNGIIKILKNTA